MPEMRSVFSSNVDQIGYDADTQELYVTWTSGRTSIYGPGVSAEEAESTMNAFSVGAAVRAIKAIHPHRYA